MRMMIKFSVPCDAGNEAVKSGKVGKVFEQLHADLKPEATYYFPNGAERGGLMVFDMADASQVAGVVERFKFGLKANVELVPVMTPADLKKGLGEMGDVIKNYG